MSQNDATGFIDDELVYARTAELGNPDFSGGMNLGASNAIGIGIATANGECKLPDWTVLDQEDEARDPQHSRHIGEASTFPISNSEAAYQLLVQADGWQTTGLFGATVFSITANSQYIELM